MTDLVGRERELAAVVDAMRTDRSVLVTGEAGIGKTALVRAAGAAAEVTLHEGGGFATLASLPYLALGRAIGRPVSGEPAVVAAAIERAVGPDVLFVDDLQWTDVGTREVVGLLVGRIALCAAVRIGDAHADAVVAELAGHGVAVVRLEGLDDPDALRLARDLRPDASEAKLRRLVALAGGNPLLIEELDASGQASPTLGRAIIAQVEALPTGARDALELLAVAGRSVAMARVGDDASTLVERGLVRDIGDGLVVRHQLIADAIVERIPDARRRELHERLAEMVDEPSARARHLAAAGRPDDASTVAQAALATTDDPRGRADLLLVLAETNRADGSEWRIRAARQLQAIGRQDEAIRILSATPLQGDDDVLAQGAAVLAGSLDEEGRGDEAWATIERSRGLRPTPGGVGATTLAISEAVVLVNRGRLDDALRVSEAAAAATRVPDRYRIDGNLAALRLYDGRTEDLEPLAAAVDGALAAKDGGTAAGRAMDLYYMTLALRGGAAAARMADAAADRLEEIGYDTRASELRAEAAQASIFGGELEGTVVRVDSMLEEPLGRLSRQRLLYDRGLALGLLGRFEDAERTFETAFEAATETFDGRGSVLWCWSEASFWRGQPARAFEQAEASLTYVAFNDAEFVLPSIARAWAEVELGRMPAATTVEAPFRMLAGAGPELDGLRASSGGDDRAAVAAFDEAAERWSGYVEPRERICRWAAGEARRRAGDDEAIERLRAALDGAIDLGFEPLAARCRRSLRLAGERSVRASMPERSGGPLTGREREVLRLVEVGHTNAEIARRMGLGRPTVARLLSNAMLKLGAESRSQAIVLAGDLV